MKKLTYNGIAWGVIFCLVMIALFLFSFHPKFMVPDMLQMQFMPRWNTFRELAGDYTTQLLKRHIRLDFAFILLYSVLFYLSIKILESALSIKVNRLILMVCFIPGIFDFIENLYFLSYIKDLNSRPSFWQYVCVVRLKWFFAIGFILINLTILFYYGLTLFGKYYDLLFGKYHGVKK